MGQAKDKKHIDQLSLPEARFPNRTELTLREHLRVNKTVLYLSHSFFIDFIHEFQIQILLILYKRKLNRHKIGYSSTINANIEKQAYVCLSMPTSYIPIFTIF